MWTPPRCVWKRVPRALHTSKPGDNSPSHLGSIVSSVFTLVLAKHFKSFNRVGPGLRGSHQQGRRTSSNPPDPVRTLARSRRSYIRVAGDESPSLQQPDILPLLVRVAWTELRSFVSNSGRRHSRGKALVPSYTLLCVTFRESQFVEFCGLPGRFICRTFDLDDKDNRSHGVDLPELRRSPELRCCCWGIASPIALVRSPLREGSPGRPRTV